MTTLPSDSHTWNLVFLQLLLQEWGHRVANLGPCVPAELLIGECLRRRADLVVVSSVNGHGCQEGVRMVPRCRRVPALAATAIVIGGKLDTGGELDPRCEKELLGAGFDAVFDDRPDSVRAFRYYVDGLTRRAGG